MCLILGGFAASHGFRSCLSQAFPSAAPGFRSARGQLLLRCPWVLLPGEQITLLPTGCLAVTSVEQPQLFPKLQRCSQRRFLTHLQFRERAGKGPACRLFALLPVPCPPHPFPERGWREAKQQALFRLSLKQQKDKCLWRWQANPHVTLELFAYF